LTQSSAGNMDTALKSQLNADLKQALRRGDKVKLAVIRAVLAAVSKAESDRKKKLVDDATSRGVAAAANSAAVMGEAERYAREEPGKSRDYYVSRAVMAALNPAELDRQSLLDNAEVRGEIAKEAKQREESIAAFKQGNRPELVLQEEAELAALRGYLPQPAGRDDIVKVARQVIAEVGAQGPRDKGKVMPRVIAQLRGRAEGREINEVVTELLG
jgi:uncharacterized protein YqeY